MQEKAHFVLSCKHRGNEFCVECSAVRITFCIVLGQVSATEFLNKGDCVSGSGKILIINLCHCHTPQRARTTVFKMAQKFKIQKDTVLIKLIALAILFVLENESCTVIYNYVF